MQALKGELEKTRVVKEKLKMIVTRVRKECDIVISCKSVDRY